MAKTAFSAALDRFIDECQTEFVTVYDLRRFVKNEMNQNIDEKMIKKISNYCNGTKRLQPFGFILAERLDGKRHKVVQYKVLKEGEKRQWQKKDTEAKTPKAKRAYKKQAPKADAEEPKDVLDVMMALAAYVKNIQEENDQMRKLFKNMAELIDPETW